MQNFKNILAKKYQEILLSQNFWISIGRHGDTNSWGEPGLVSVVALNHCGNPCPCVPFIWFIGPSMIIMIVFIDSCHVKNRPKTRRFATDSSRISGAVTFDAWPRRLAADAILAGTLVDLHPTSSHVLRILLIVPSQSAICYIVSKCIKYVHICSYLISYNM